MSEELPPGLTLEVVAEFHAQLLRLQNAGLRLQIDEGKSTGQSLPERLNEIMAGLVSQVGKTKQLDQVLQEASFVPLRYRMALETWAKCDRSVEALSTLRAPVQQESEGSIDLRYALLLPLIVLTLVYLASFYLLQVTVPHMEGIYLQLNEQPSWSVRWLMSIRDAMPYWGPGLPVLALVVVWSLFSGRLTLPRWLPGRRQAYRYSAASMLARNVAVQMDRAVEGSSAEQLISTGQGVPALRGLLQSPMLRWALASEQTTATTVTEQALIGSTGQPLATLQQARRLRLAANLYETMQTMHAMQFRGWLILLACIVLGGGITLLYGLALFMPLVQLLKDIIGK